MLWNGKKMISKLREAEAYVDRNTVTHDMKTVVLKVNHPFALRILHPCLANVPLLRNRPIKHLCPACYFMYFKWKLLLNNFQRLAKAGAGNTSVNRIKPRH